MVEAQLITHKTQVVSGVLWGSRLACIGGRILPRYFGGIVSRIRACCSRLFEIRLDGRQDGFLLGDVRETLEDVTRLTHPDNGTNLAGKWDLTDGDMRYVEWPGGAPFEKQQQDAKTLSPATGRR